MSDTFIQTLQLTCISIFAYCECVIRMISFVFIRSNSSSAYCNLRKRRNSLGQALTYFERLACEMRLKQLPAL